MTLSREWYAKHIKKILASKRSCRRWIAGMVIASVIAISFPFIGVLKVHLFPQYNADFVVVDIEGPIGSTLEDTRKTAEKVEKLVEELPELDNFVTIIGGEAIYSTEKQQIVEPIGINYASITINLTKKADRKLKSYEISEILRKKVKSITEAEIMVRDFRLGPPITAPIEIRVMGEDMQKIEAFAEVVKKELKRIKGARDVSTDVEHGTGEFHFALKRDQLEFYGLSVAQWGNEIRTAIFGSKGIKVIRAGEETPIVVRLDFRDEDCKQDKAIQILEKRDKITICNLNPKDVDQIKRLLIPTPRGQVPLGQLVDIELKPTITTIRHRDGEMVVNVTASTQSGVLPVEVTDAFQERMKEISFPEGIKIEYGGELERATESFEDLRSAMIIALLLILLILILQLNSFKQPLIILFTLPLAFIGVFFGFALLRHNFSFSGFIGIVALSGIVVNDAIIFIDRINSNIRYGMDKIKAIITAGKERFQPIILTTITTAAAVFPLTFASENWEDMAWALFFGIIFATVLTLVMVPIFYTILEKAKLSETP
jgi:HAE1 family hydrophobic/amphiphilic exporter-1